MVLFNYIFMAEKHFRAYHRGDLDPVSRTCFKNIHTSRTSKGNIKPLFFNVQGRREILRFLRNERINSRVTYVIRCKSRLTLVHIITNHPRPSVKVTFSYVINFGLDPASRMFPLHLVNKACHVLIVLVQ